MTSGAVVGSAVGLGVIVSEASAVVTPGVMVPSLEAVGGGLAGAVGAGVAVCVAVCVPPRSIVGVNAEPEGPWVCAGTEGVGSEPVGDSATVLPLGDWDAVGALLGEASVVT